MFFLCIALSEFADLAQVILAIASLFLAGYIFIYQRRKDANDNRATALLNEQNIKLQWFKELVVQPNMVTINEFYESLHNIRNSITSDNLKDTEKQNISTLIKKEAAEFRKKFIDLVLQVDRKFGDRVMENIDQLVDELTEAIFNDELKLTLTTVYEKHFLSKISYSKNTLYGMIYNYKGV